MLLAKPGFYGLEYQSRWRRRAESNRRIKVLQTSPLATWVRRRKKMERETGLEPATSTLARWRSTTELFPLVLFFSYFRLFNINNKKPHFFCQVKKTCALGVKSRIPDDKAAKAVPRFYSGLTGSDRSTALCTAGVRLDCNRAKMPGFSYPAVA